MAHRAAAAGRGWGCSRGNRVLHVGLGSREAVGRRREPRSSAARHSSDAHRLPRPRLGGHGLILLPQLLPGVENDLRAWQRRCGCRGMFLYRKPLNCVEDWGRCRCFLNGGTVAGRSPRAASRRATWPPLASRCRPGTSASAPPAPLAVSACSLGNRGGVVGAKKAVRWCGLILLLNNATVTTAGKHPPPPAHPTAAGGGWRR